MRVTILCDASFCPRYKVAGYGYWIASKRGKEGGGGKVKWDVEDTNSAEMMAVCNSMFHGFQSRLVMPEDEILIQTDSTAAIERFDGKKVVTITRQQQDVLSYYEKFIAQNNLKVSFRHVKGHTLIQEARYAANRACDMRAKKHMREARKEKLAEPHIKLIKEMLNVNDQP